MANASIKAAFERMWQYVISSLDNKSDISHNHDDKYYTETEMDSKISNINESISKKTDTLRNAAGATITMSDSAKVPIQGLRLFGKTTQNGTPSPNAPVTLVSAGDGGSLGVTVAGKNLLSNNATSGTINGVTFTVNADGSVTMNGTATADVSFPIFGNNWNDTSKKLILDGNIDYILSKGTANAVVYARDAISNRNFETPLNSYRIIEKVDCLTYVYIRILKGKTLNNETIYPMIRLASIADDIYEPYKQSQTLNLSTPNGLPGIPVTSGGNYTDENGQQWVCDEVDFSRGVYVKKVKKKRLSSSLGWSYSTGTRRFYVQDSEFKSSPTASYDMHGNMCTHFKVSQNHQLEDLEMSYINQTSFGFGYRYDALNGNVDAWKAFLNENEVYIVAELATPIETPLSAEELAAYAALHTNYPNTTVLNNGGAGMEVKYCTPSTSVPMVHSEGDKGKILTIDEHGCVAKAVPGEFSAIDVDFGVSNEAEPSPINADTLGGRSADEYILKSQIPIEANYSVIGGITEPTNPTQNMIWVNTDIPVGRVFFGDNEPNETFIDGDVWIKTGISSNAAFNALRIGENYVNMVYPISAKQYVTGAWVDVTAKSYRSGKWVDWIVCLYKNGDEYTKLTGGWVPNRPANWFTTNGTFTKNAKSITVAVASKSSAMTAIQTNKIDLTNYNTLRFNVVSKQYGSNYTNIFLAVFGESMTDNGAVVVVYGDAIEIGTNDLDISAVSGKYYVGFGAWTDNSASSYIEVNEVSLI